MPSATCSFQFGHLLLGRDQTTDRRDTTIQAKSRGRDTSGVKIPKAVRQHSRGDPMIRSAFAILLLLAATGSGRALIVQTPDFSGHWISRGTINLLPPQVGDTGSSARGAE